MRVACSRLTAGLYGWWCVGLKQYSLLYAGPESTHTGLVDGTPVYGTIEATEEELKDPNRDGCHLRAEPGPKGEFLPLAAQINKETGKLEVSIVAGDFRAEEQAILTAMHTVSPACHATMCT